MRHVRFCKRTHSGRCAYVDRTFVWLGSQSCFTPSHPVFIRVCYFQIPDSQAGDRRFDWSDLASVSALTGLTPTPERVLDSNAKPAPPSKNTRICSRLS